MATGFFHTTFGCMFAKLLQYGFKIAKLIELLVVITFLVIIRFWPATGLKQSNASEMMQLNQSPQNKAPSPPTLPQQQGRLFSDAGRSETTQHL